MNGHPPHLIEGLWCATLTPVSADGAIDDARFAAHVQWLFAQGVAGVAPFGTTGEGQSFSVDERRAGLDALEAAHRDIVKRAAKGVTPALLDAAQAVDWGLHDMMIDALGNEIVSSIYRVNSLRIRLIRLDRVTLNAESLQPAMAEHLALLAALRTRDPARAVAAMEAHLTHARNRALGL